jgi:hypothetical protein
LNKRELRELMLDRYEDSLYASRYQRKSRRSKKAPDASSGLTSLSGKAKTTRRRRHDTTRRHGNVSSLEAAMVDVTK